ncbi:MAG: tetratricopeptide repeat protein [Bacteroidota bacterium]|nr:tetratricopeptide repeat protein [Bacteroidota bacterium]
MTEKKRFIKPAIITVVGVVMAISAFIPGINAPFFNDDNVYIIGNKNFETPVTEVWKFLFERTNNYEYLPIRDIIYRIEFEMFEDNPIGYRIVNFVLYALCCFGVYITARMILKIITAKVAGTDHNRIEWISSLKDLLSGVLMLFSLFYFLKGIIDEVVIKKHLYVSWILFLLALFSKSTVLPMIVIIFIIAIVRFGIDKLSIKKSFSLTQPYLIIGFVFLFIYMHTGSDSKILAAPFLFGSFQSIVNNFHIPVIILGYLVRIALLPIDLRLIYDVMDFGMPFITAIVLGAICIVSVVAAFRFMNKRYALTAFGIIWFTVFTLPYLQIIPFNSWSFASERYLFLSIYGLALIITSIIFLLNKRFGIAAAFIIIVVYLSSTFHYSLMWRNNETLIENNARFSPNHTKSQMMYVESVLMPNKRYKEAIEIASKTGTTEIDRERFVRYVKVFQAYDSDQWEEIDKHCEWLEGMTGMHSSTGFLNILGIHYENKGDFIKAIEYYYYAMDATYTNEDHQGYAERIKILRYPYEHKINELEMLLKIDPNSINVIGALANLQMQIFMLDEAQTNYAKILKLDPENKIAYYNLGLLFRKKGEDAQSVIYLQQAVDLGFVNAMVLNNLAIGYKNIEDLEKAEEMFLKAIELDENYWFASFNLAKLYALNKNNQKAVEYFEKSKMIVVEQGLSSENIDSYLTVIYKVQDAKVN